MRTSKRYFMRAPARVGAHDQVLQVQAQHTILSLADGYSPIDGRAGACGCQITALCASGRATQSSSRGACGTFLRADSAPASGNRLRVARAAKPVEFFVEHVPHGQFERL